MSGAGGEPCRSCGAAMAEDQRYCLNCGERRGGPRVDFRQHLDSAKEEGPSVPPNGAASPATSSPAPKASEGERRQRDYAPLAAAGGIAVLGIMLLIGVLIGRGTGDSGSTAAQPSVITVAAEGTSDEEAGGGGEEAGGKKQGKGDTKKQAKRKDGAANGGSSDTGNAPVASDDELKELQEQSPEEYSESSAKLPDEIATPGEPPPTDGKTPGGGSGGTTIE
jgi:hypothetical protein